jgi:hypothetical protein
MIVCMLGLFVSEVVMNGEIDLPKGQWERIGGDDF